MAKSLLGSDSELLPKAWWSLPRFAPVKIPGWAPRPQTKQKTSCHKPLVSNRGVLLARTRVAQSECASMTQGGKP